MRPELGYALPDLLALGVHPLHGRYRVRFNDGVRHRRFDTKALGKRRRFFDKRSQVSFPIGHGNSPKRSPYRAEPSASMLLRGGRYRYCG